MSDVISKLKTGLVSFGFAADEGVNASPGLYCFWLRGTCLYVGMSTNLKRRIAAHCTGETNPELADYFDTFEDEIKMAVAYIDAPEDELRKMEAGAMSKLHPITNRQGM